MPIREYPLNAVRADGWFERLGIGNPNFGQLCALVGEKPLAFSVIVGAQITAVMVDRRVPDASVVEFVVGDDPSEHRMPLGEFRRRMTLALLGDDEMRPPLGADPEPEDVQSFLGARIVLLAPLFGVRLDRLIVDDELAPQLEVTVGETTQIIPVDALLEVLLDRVRSEAQGMHGGRTSIDLAAIDEAFARAERGDWDGTIELLGAWPGPLSMLLRTAEGAQLSPEVRSQLARALALLGTAYVRKERYEHAEEVMRLGIQYGQDGPAAADIFRRLGESNVERGRYGEAIGFLRRGLSLGGHPKETLPALARALDARGKHVAAMALIEESLALGVPEASVADVRASAAAALGDAWVAFRARVPRATAGADTVPPPPGRSKEDG